MKVYLIDTKKIGHHEIYKNSLLKLNNTIDKYEEFSNSKIKIRFNVLNYFFREIKNTIFINKKIMEILKENKKEEKIVHILTLDFFYRIFYLNNKVKIIGTLHKIPKNKKQIWILKKFSKKIKKIIVHSEFMRDELNNLGIMNVEVIDYPSFFCYSKENKKRGKKVISCLGETRKDKGIDIALEAFKLLDKTLYKQIILNIAGREVDIKKDYILNELRKLNIEYKLNLDYISDEEFKKNVEITDIMLMPYRKVFTGNSGPMTEAIVNKIPCIVPSGDNLEKLTLKYKLGLVFEVENPKDLAQKIDDILRKKMVFYDNNFYKSLTEENFLKKYAQIYNEVIKLR